MICSPCRGAADGGGVHECEDAQRHLMFEPATCSYTSCTCQCEPRGSRVFA